jgi:hypothetical protein
MKQLVVFLLFPFFSAAQFSMDFYYPQKTFGALGVESCSIYEVNLDGSLELEQTYKFNAMGELIENHRDFQGFSLIGKFDANNRKVAEYMIPFGEDFFERDTLIYNKKGELVMKITYSHDGKESKRNEYDYKNGKLFEERYILDGQLQVKSVFKNDDKTNSTRETRFFRGQHQEDWVRIFNEKGDLIRFITITPKGDTTLLNTFTYNQNGDLIEHHIYSGAEIIHYEKITYKANGLIDYVIENGEKKIYMYKAIGSKYEKPVSQSEMLNCGIYVPQIFTPSPCDMAFRFFTIIGVEEGVTIELELFNHLGDAVYINHNYQNDWDGSIVENNDANSQRYLPEGTYFYVLTIGGNQNHPCHGKTIHSYVYFIK